ncbi:MAG: enoyl-CoA hydratase-related protein [Rhodoglobus sp.]
MNTLPAETDEILVDVAGAVGVITLNAPERRNALTPQMARRLTQALDALDEDERVGAVVIQGNGPTFCAGAHRQTLLDAEEDPAQELVYSALSDIYAAFVRAGTIGVPTISAIQGTAVGAGLNLALSTDLRILGTEARLRSAFSQIGLHPGGGHFSLLARAAGREATAAAALFGEDIDAQRAVQLGLAWEAVPDPDVRPRAMELAGRVAADRDLARALVRSFRLQTQQGPLPLDVALQLERPSQMWSMRRKRA